MNVADAGLPLALLIAAAAGLVSFASPCVLPLVPGFLGYVTGLSGTDLAARSRTRMVLGSALFVAGFTVVFLLGTLLVAGAGRSMVEHRALLMRVGGVGTILLGLVFLGVGATWGWQRQVHWRFRPTAGLVGAPLLGATFGLSWAPCTGPTLGAVLTLAATANVSADGGAVLTRALLLGAAYCLGLGLPFLAIAAAYQRSARVSAWLQRHARAIQLAGGLLLVGVGVLLLTGTWDNLTTWLQLRIGASYEVPL